MNERPPGPPSPRWGWHQVRRLWRLVIAVWAVSWLAVVPALLVVRRLIFPGLSSLPSGTGEAPDGELALIVLEAARGAVVPLALAALSGMAVLWAWAVLWHAGVVRWQLRTGGRRARLGELLAVRVADWWRYARLSATALAALAVAAAAVLVPLGWSAVGALAAMAERRLLVLLGIGVVATKLVAIVVWLATLHGAWLLGLPGRRSAVVAWLLGLRATARRPLASLWALLVWLVPALLVSAVAPLLGATFPGLRGGPVLVVAGLLASFARAFCWVGLFCSFAPLTGLVGSAEGPLEADASSTQEEYNRGGLRPDQGQPPGEPDLDAAAP